MEDNDNVKNDQIDEYFKRSGCVSILVIMGIIALAIVVVGSICLFKR